MNNTSKKREKKQWNLVGKVGKVGKKRLLLRKK